MIRDTDGLIDRKFIGIPYEFGSADFTAADCMGIVVLYLAEHGINYPYETRDLAALKHWWESNPRRFMDYLFKFGEMVRFGEVEKFDVMFFMGEGGSMAFPSYPGVMIDSRHFLTSYDKKESHVIMLNELWKNRFWGAIRPRRAD